LNKQVIVHSPNLSFQNIFRNQHTSTDHGSRDTKLRAQALRSHHSSTHPVFMKLKPPRPTGDGDRGKSRGCARIDLTKEQKRVKKNGKKDNSRATVLNGDRDKSRGCARVNSTEEDEEKEAKSWSLQVTIGGGHRSLIIRHYLVQTHTTTVPWLLILRLPKGQSPSGMHREISCEGRRNWPSASLQRGP
jgi:hypothetical protein